MLLVVSLLVVRCGVAFGFVCCLIGLISRFGDLGFVLVVAFTLVWLVCRCGCVWVFELWLGLVLFYVGVWVVACVLIASWWCSFMRSLLDVVLRLLMWIVC